MRQRSMSACATMALLGAPKENVQAPPECGHIRVGNVSLTALPFTTIVRRNGVGSMLPSSAPPLSSTDVRIDQTPSQFMFGGAVLSPHARAVRARVANQMLRIVVPREAVRRRV